MTLGKLAGDIAAQLKMLAQREAQPHNLDHWRAREAETRGQQLFLAATPAEDVDDLRDELTGLLRANGCVVVPEGNPLDVEQVHEHAGEWIANCDKFVQVLGSISGAWRHDETGFVIYQHELAKKNDKTIFVYRRHR